MEEGVLIDKDENGDETKFNFNVNEDGTFVEPKDVEQYVRIMIKNDGTIGSTKDDRALVGKIIEQIRKKQVEEVEEEENIEITGFDGRDVALSVEEVTKLTPQFDEISKELINLSSDLDDDKLNKIIDQSIANFKTQFNKNVPKKQIINALIALQKNSPNYKDKQALSGAVKWSKENLIVSKLEKLLQE